MFPLTGLRVLDMSRVLAGPFAGRMLADLGADVVKVEPPEGDVTRLWGARDGDISGYFHQQNVGKRGICVDLTKPGAAQLIVRLAAIADVLIENFRPGVMERLGVGFAALSAENPRLVMLSISGFGAGGPESGRAAYAPIIHAESGVMARQAQYNASKPADMALSIADTNASLHGLVGMFAALWLRERTGVGQHIDMAMIDAMLVTDDNAHYYLEDSVQLRPMRSEVWKTGVGPVLIAGDFRHIWRQLTGVCKVVDPAPPNAELTDKVRQRRGAAAVFFAAMTDRSEFTRAMREMNLAWGDVRAPENAFELPTVQARQTVAQVNYGEAARPVVQSPYRFSAADSQVRGPAPHQGEHNAEVLREWLGTADFDIERLVADGVLCAGDHGK